MKKITLLALLISNFIVAQPLAIDWQKTFGGSADETFGQAKVTPDGGFIICGETKSNNGDISNNQGDYDVWIVKTSSLGVLEWQKTFGGSEYDSATSIEITADGGYIFAGAASSNNGDVVGQHGIFVGPDVWIVKLSSTGEMQWQKTLGGTSYDVAKRIITTSDGGFIIAGTTSSNNGDVSGLHGDDQDCWIIKLSSTGEIIWKNVYGGTLREIAHDIIETADGGYIIAGEAASIDGDVSSNHGTNGDAWIIKLDAVGNIQWERAYGGSGYERAFDIEATQDGGYIFSTDAGSNDGDMTGLHSEYDDIWIVKIDAIGNIEWQKALGGTSSEVVSEIEQTADSGYVLFGLSNSNDGDVSGNFGELDLWMVKLDAFGNIEWQRNFGGTGEEYVHYIGLTPDGNPFTVGSTNSYDNDVTQNQGGRDAWIVKFKQETLHTNQFEKNSIEIAPNPATSTIAVKFQKAIEKISIYDISGKIILKQNEYTNPLNIEKLSSGMYFLEVTSAGQKFQTKFIKQ